MTSIRTILTIHDQYSSSKSLKHNLGDGYLITFNSIYRKIRHHTLKSGYSFTKDRFYHYDVLPMIELARIHSQKTIPYRDNVSVLRLIRDAPNWIFETSPDLLGQENFIFHESCHAVARNIIESHLNRPLLSRALQLKTISVLMEESFANSVEAMAVGYVNSARHRLFLQRNSYMKFDKDWESILRIALKTMAPQKLFQFLFYCFLHANFLYAELRSTELDRILKLIYDGKNLKKFDKQSRTLFRHLAKIALGLQANFRLASTQLFFRSQRIDGHIEKLVDFDFMDLIENNLEIRSCVVKMTSII